MRPLVAVILLLPLAGCGGGGGAPAPKPPIELELDFQGVRGDLPTTRTVEIENPFSREATVELGDPAAGRFEPGAGALPGALPGGGTFVLRVVFTPDGTGTFDEMLRLVVRDTRGREREVELSLSAQVEEPRLSLLTPSLDFGDVRIGASGTRSVTIRNDSAFTPVRVTGASSLPERFASTTVVGTIAPGSTRVIDLSYVPAELGAPSFQWTIEHEADGSPFVLPVTASTTTWIQRQVFDLGSVPVDGGDTDWLEVQAPPHAISVSLEADGPPTAVIGLSGFEGPGGKVYENDAITGDYLQVPEAGLFTATLPNTDRPNIQLVPGGGTYRFRFRIFQGSASQLSVRAIVLNRPDGTVDGGILPLNVFLARGLGIDEEDAETDARLQGILDETDRIFSQHGLRLGPIDYFVLDDADFDAVTGGEFPRLLEESDRAPETRVNLFFVQTAIGSGVLGVAARIAGPARNGTELSGVMVDFDFGGVGTAGHVTAHEIGHFLGLFHTVEQSGAHDIIDDTLECPPNGTDAVCTTEGADYLMHWRLLSSDPVITLGQAHVALAHPLVDEKPALSAAPLRILAASDTPPPRDELPPNWCGCEDCTAVAR